MLLALSDDLTKSDLLMGAVVKKIQRAYFEVVKTRPKSAEELHEEKTNRRKKEAAPPALTVADKHPQDYLQSFEFNQRRYPPNTKLEDMMKSAMTQMHTDDDHLKTLMAAYNDVRTSVEATERKEQGSLLVKPLASLVKKTDVLDTEHLSTIMLVVPKKAEKAFLAGYEVLEAAHRAKKASRGTPVEAVKHEEVVVEVDAEEEKKMEAPALTKAREKKEADKAEKEAARARRARLPHCDNVVPRSANKLSEDKEFCLYSVLVFKKGEDNFKNICRQERYTVRPYKYDPKEEKTAMDSKKKLLKKRAKLFSNLVQWTKTMFSHHFVAWIHIKVMRCFVEAVLRYGLPIDIQCFCIQPKTNADAKVRKALSQVYQHLGNPDMLGGEEDMGALESQFGDFYPYVSLDFNLDKTL